MIEAASISPFLFWSIAAGAVYVFGALVTVVIAGFWAVDDSDDVAKFAFFWPVVAAFIVVAGALAGPFYGAWHLGVWLRRKFPEAKS